MKKEIKKIGNSKGITFSPEECRIYNIKLKDVFDIELVRLKKNIQMKGGKENGNVKRNSKRI
jgi:hypothetical protein